MSHDEVEESTPVDLDVAFKNLEAAWFKKAAFLKCYLVSPLHDAAAKGNLERIQRLVEMEGVSVDTIDNAKNTPLHWASGAGRTNVVEYLINKGCDLNMQNLLGDTALHRATWRNQLAVVNQLLDAGINIQVINAQGKRAIDLVREVEIGAAIQRQGPTNEEEEKLLELMLEGLELDDEEFDSDDSDTD